MIRRFPGALRADHRLFPTGVEESLADTQPALFLIVQHFFSLWITVPLSTVAD